MVAKSKGGVHVRESHGPSTPTRKEHLRSPKTWPAVVGFADIKMDMQGRAFVFYNVKTLVVASPTFDCSARFVPVYIVLVLRFASFYLHPFPFTTPGVLSDAAIPLPIPVQHASFGSCMDIYDHRLGIHPRGC